MNIKDEIINPWVDIQTKGDYNVLSLQAIEKEERNLTILGKLLRHIRIEHDEVLYDMAKRLDVTSSFLSAVENGGKSPPPYWADILISEYALNTNDAQALREAVAESIKQVRIDVASSSRTTRDMILAFARSYDKLNDESIDEIMRILNKKDGGL